MLDLRRPTVGWLEILRRTAKEIDRDNCFGLSAQLAFYFFLGLFPALLFFVALISFLPLASVLDDLLAALAGVAPPDVLSIIRRQLEQVAGGGRGGLLTVGIIGALWSSSAAMDAIITALNRAYGITERRPWWKRRLVALTLTVALAMFIILSSTLVVAGPAIADGLAQWFGLGWLFALTWKIVQWPVAFVLVVIAVDLIYHFAPNAKKRWRWITTGSFVATTLWLASSLGFRFYVVNFGTYNATYGAIGAVIVLMLWFYLSALAILAGAELNAEIDKAGRAATPADGSR